MCLALVCLNRKGDKAKLHRSCGKIDEQLESYNLMRKREIETGIERSKGYENIV